MPGEEFALPTDETGTVAYVPSSGRSPACGVTRTARPDMGPASPHGPAGVDAAGSTVAMVRSDVGLR